MSRFPSVNCGSITQQPYSTRRSVLTTPAIYMYSCLLFLPTLPIQDFTTGHRGTMSQLYLYTFLSAVTVTNGDSLFDLDSQLDLTSYDLLSSASGVSRIKCVISCERHGCGHVVWDEDTEMCHLYSVAMGTGKSHPGDVYSGSPCVTLATVCCVFTHSLLVTYKIIYL